MNIFFMGTPDFSVPSLELFVKNYNVLGVFTQPPRPSGRGMNKVKSPIHNFSERNDLNLFTPVSLKNKKYINILQKLKPDLVVVVAYGLIVPELILNIPKYGCINGHASLLPKWRGAAPIQRAIEAGDKQTGICIMQMDETLDTGAIIHSEPIFIDSQATALSLHDQLSVLGGNIINVVLESLIDGSIEAMPQSDQEVTYAKKITKNESRINWFDSAKSLERKIRALEPWPGARFNFKGEEIKIFGSEIFEVDLPKDTPVGTIIDDRLTVLCGNGAIRPIDLQRPGRRRLDLDQFLMGYRITKGDQLS